MKINSYLSILCSLLFFACSHVPDKNVSNLRSLTDTLPLDRSKNIIIYTVNPNDCISCVDGFKLINSDLSHIQNSRVYVISVEREIEKNEFIKNIKDIDLSNSKNKVVLWSKSLFDGINRSVNKNLPLSLVCIYNYKTDSVIYCKPIREVANEEELRTNLEKE